jgi:hypothetical protein
MAWVCLLYQVADVMIEAHISISVRKHHTVNRSRLTSFLQYLIYGEEA